VVNLFIEAFIVVQVLLGLALLWRGYQLLDAQIDWESLRASWNQRPWLQIRLEPLVSVMLIVSGLYWWVRSR
jgi:hypothetical protein